MQYVGSLTARPIKNYYVFKFQQLSGYIIFKKIIIIIIIIMLIIIIITIIIVRRIKYVHSNYSDQPVQSDKSS